MLRTIRGSSLMSLSQDHVFAFQHLHSTGIKRDLNSHSDKPSKLIKICNKPGRKGEGKGLGGEMESCHSTHHRFGAGEKSKPGVVPAPEQSPPILTHTFWIGFHGVAGAYTTSIPPKGQFQAFRWEVLPSLKKAPLSTTHKERD